MCGIGGYVGERNLDISQKIISLIAHRGPDGQGHWEDRALGVGLCHTRLSILDLSEAAAQPMKSVDGRFILIYNGEIYNFRELRSKLQSQGDLFTSTGDTEVLLKGLAREGESFVRQLNGIFAFALWDAAKRELLLARDPLGVKPLYFVEPSPGTLTFGSEIKALLANPRVKATPNYEALLQHLSFCHASGSGTALKGVQRLEGGCTLRWSAENPKPVISRYWKPQFGGPGGNREEAVDQLRMTLKKAVQRQLISEVPVGAFFSGGLDSTLIAALSVPELKNSFNCYTITYPSSENVVDGAAEDGPFAQRAANQLKLSHVNWEIKPEVAYLWPRLLYHLDEPIADPAAIACYLVSKLARNNHTKVLLSGQGADELFGGYPRYPVMHATRFSEYLPQGLRQGLAGIGAGLPGALEGSWGARIRRIRRVLVSLEKRPDLRFLSYCANTPEEAVLSVLSPDVRRAIVGLLPSDECVRHMESSGLMGHDRWFDRDLGVYLPNHNLLYTDKMSMAVGVETRVPFLDLEVVNQVTAMPMEWKIRGGTTKAILRDAARGLVPDEVIDRPKAGFGAPYRKWLRYDLSEMWEDLTTESAVKSRGWFDPQGLKEIRDRSQSGKEDLYMLQWAVLTIELWARQFIDRNPAKDN
jgi:asparagine synthase (glutamine-hydrolysing)